MLASFIPVVLAYAPQALITAVTPGPNNLLSLYMASTIGIRKGAKTYAGMFLGFFSVMLLCAAFSYALSTLLPAALPALKLIGAAYLLYLAWNVAHIKAGRKNERQVTFLQGMLLQLVNVKMVLNGLSIMGGYILPAPLPLLMLHALALTCIGASGWLLWSIAGNSLQRLLVRHERAVGLVMAALLVWCAARMLL